ncbi:4-alpha-glucanotransferase [Marivita hallyeonensis]|uniref:4-alpha-glucanotransferase n=1 Tax=Marivita hallyeonensis TaxID=996342 RepID=A0A1M5WU52_9RHOB|nr:4-alpha-glucanotransferase [Marivita hallyeonensis]SHH91011.1 4-alpha-glucanotransferase [Marivita hallyeonensis]
MSTADDTLRELAAENGIYLEFFDLHGVRHAATPDTLRALLKAIGVAATSEAEVHEALAERRGASRRMPAEHIVAAGQEVRISAPDCTWVLETEAGDVVAEGRSADGIGLPQVEVGYYRLRCEGPDWSAETFVLARPARAPSMPQAPCWGATGALYGLRSDRNGGLGSYPELGVVSETLGRAGAQFFGINPVHAIGWATTDMISPYSPSHRGAFNTDHIAPATGLGPCPDDALIDYAAFRERQRTVLRQDFATFQASGDRTAFAAWCETCSADIKTFAVFEAISERHGHDFRRWPTALQQPGRAADAEARDNATFHLWLQWLAQTQLDAAQARATASGMALGLYLDLAVGPRPDGAEVWMNAATIAKGVTIGAPPDHLSPEGQSWALAAHAPGQLAAYRYAPFRSMLRNLMARCGLLRIDHALGLLRSFLIPDDGSPGGYIAQPLDSLLAVITIEAHRAGCVVVGEDLGLVPNGLRAAMKASGLYSYSVWQFEANHLGEIRPADSLAPDSLACFGTHDTPTVQGFWYGNDIDWWQRVGWITPQERADRHGDRARQRASLRKVSSLRPSAAAPEITETLHDRLAASPAAMVSVQLDDVFGAVEAQNLPGTIDEHPNWRRRLPVSLDEMAQSDALARTAGIMNRHRAPAQDEPELPHTKELTA